MPVSMDHIIADFPSKNSSVFIHLMFFSYRIHIFYTLNTMFPLPNNGQFLKVSSIHFSNEKPKAAIRLSVGVFTSSTNVGTQTMV